MTGQYIIVNTLRLPWHCCSPSALAAQKPEAGDYIPQYPVQLALTSSKNTLATWPYRGDRKRKSVWKVSQQVLAQGPGLNSQVVSRWSKSELSLTREMTLSGLWRYTSDVYLPAVHA